MWICPDAFIDIGFESKDVIDICNELANNKLQMLTENAMDLRNFFSRAVFGGAHSEELTEPDWANLLLHDNPEYLPEADRLWLSVLTVTNSS